MKNEDLLPDNAEGNICQDENDIPILGNSRKEYIEKHEGKKSLYLCKIPFSIKTEYFVHIFSTLLYFIICA